jgi:hypothetical protein
MIALPTPVLEVRVFTEEREKEKGTWQVNKCKTSVQNSYFHQLFFPQTALFFNNIYINFIFIFVFVCFLSFLLEHEALMDRVFGNFCVMYLQG